MVGMATNALVTYKGIRLTPGAKHTIIPEWGRDRNTRMLERINTHLGDPAFIDIQKHEGLGVDHEKWLEQKQAAKS